jgi:hypothetical protein
MSRWVGTPQTADPWPSRIGAEASALLRRAAVYRQGGTALALLFVAVCIGFQFAENEPGIIASAALCAAGVAGPFVAIRRMAAARRLVADRLAMPPAEARYVRLRHGPDGYDRWLAARGRPGWPQRF